jgi:hypothetical protein
MRALLISTAFLYLLNLSCSYFLPFKNKVIKNSELFSSSYKAALEAARLAKQNGSKTSKVTSESLAVAAPTQSKQINLPPQFSRQESSSTSDDLPFSDEMYEHLKFCITKISNRMKSHEPLSSADMNKLESSIYAIIQDAKGYGNTESSMVSVEAISDMKDESKNIFSGFGGWAVPGMENM